MRQIIQLKIRTIVNVLFFLCLLPKSSFGLSSDQYLPYYVRAHSIIYKRKLHLTIYRGDVHATQGTSTLSGDQVVLYNSTTNHDIQRVVATGHPAHYATLPDHQQDRLLAQAETIEYYPKTNQVLLLIKARVTQHENVFTGPHIWYDIKNQTVVATNPRGNSHTTIVIEPQNKH